MECPRLRKSINWNGPVAILGLFALFVLVLGSSAPVPIAPHAQALLLQMASENLDATINVIVQKAGRDDRAEKQVTALGGNVTTELAIINAFAAQINSTAIPQLARADGVRWVSLDAPMYKSECLRCVSTQNLQNSYIYAIKADQVWNRVPYLQGQGIGVAVVDSGLTQNKDFMSKLGRNRFVASAVFNRRFTGYDLGSRFSFDLYGHGELVAGIIGGSGLASDGKYIGVAPSVNLINVKVSDDQGESTASNVVRGLQWILNNKDNYNIRVVNLSLNSAAPESYNTSPIDAAVEILWFNKIVVVASSGNEDRGALYPPANDPFVITVGATDDRGTKSISDDVVASFSGYGQTTDGIAKPDLVAPGVNIVSDLPRNPSVLAKTHPDNVVDKSFFRLSGTSVAAPMVAGAAALLVQSNPNLTPDQVKYRLLATANKSWQGYGSDKAGAGYLDISAAVQSNASASSNTGLPASQLLWSGSQPVTWGSVNWNSVNWNSVNWNSVNWNSVNWNSVNWNSDYWGP